MSRVTRATDRPVRRVVLAMGGELVVEVRDRMVTLRPLRSRADSARVELTWGALYIRAIDSGIEERRRARRQRRIR